MNEKINVLAITGPTASGKSSLAIALAKALDGEIVSTDSMQIYRGMDIGTAKATVEERREVPHHLIDILDPDESFSAADYAVRAEAAITDIALRGKLPILCGGTGLYLEALRTARHGEVMPSDPAFREEMRALAEKEGKEAVHARLREVDAESAEAVHPNNLTRVIRALEIYRVTGKPKSVLDREAPTENPRLSILNITLTYLSRELLYSRIDERVDQMMAEGLLAETRRLFEDGKLREGSTAAAAIGYKECLGAVRGEMTEDAARETLKLATHHYAKRQITWFSAKEHIPVYMDESGEMRSREDVLSELMTYAKEFLSSK